MRRIARICWARNLPPPEISCSSLPDQVLLVSIPLAFLARFLDWGHAPRMTQRVTGRRSLEWSGVSEQLDHSGSLADSQIVSHPKIGVELFSSRSHSRPVARNLREHPAAWAPYPMTSVHAIGSGASDESIGRSPVGTRSDDPCHEASRNGSDVDMYTVASHMDGFAAVASSNRQDIPPETVYLKQIIS